jgi:periplasmic divalent cation tolerance protein
MNKFSEPIHACCVVMCTFPNAEVASEVSKSLLLENLIACCTMVSESVSMYRWKGNIEQSTEIQCLFKTKESKIEELTLRLSSLHPYEVPEIIVVNGLTTASYSSWIDSCLM